MTDAALPPTRWGGAAHVFVADLDAPDPAPDDRHHLERVLRLRPGDLVTASDGRGRWRWARVGAAFEPLGDVVAEPAPAPVLTVGFALLKGERNELVVQKLTELGIDVVAPFHAERSVVRWDGARGDRHVERLRRVAREAAMQCRRVRLPEVRPVCAFRDLLGASTAVASIDGSAPTLRHRTVLVGPEGGWSDAEDASGAHKVRIADLVLRGETAAITAGAILTAMRSGLVLPYAT
jgi:16S rRNA (uracil1498-N3)-methyltransferase